MRAWTDRPPLTQRQEEQLARLYHSPFGVPAGNVDLTPSETLCNRGLARWNSSVRRWVITLAGRDLAEELGL